VQDQRLNVGGLFNFSLQPTPYSFGARARRLLHRASLGQN